MGASAVLLFTASLSLIATASFGQAPGDDNNDDGTAPPITSLKQLLDSIDQLPSEEQPPEPEYFASAPPGSWRALYYQKVLAPGRNEDECHGILAKILKPNCNGLGFTIRWIARLFGIHHSDFTRLLGKLRANKGTHFGGWLLRLLLSYISNALGGGHDEFGDHSSPGTGGSGGPIIKVPPGGAQRPPGMAGSSPAGVARGPATSGLGGRPPYPAGSPPYPAGTKPPSPQQRSRPVGEVDPASRKAIPGTIPGEDGVPSLPKG